MPIILATRANNARMIHLELPGRNWYTTPEYQYLYEYHDSEGGEEPTASDGSDESGKQQDRKAYYRAVNTYGMPVPERVFTLDRDSERPGDDVVYAIRWSTHPEQGTHEISGTLLAEGSFWARYWPDVPISSRHERDLYANVVKALVRVLKLPVIRGHTSTGFHQDLISGEWYYVFQDGRCLDLRAERTLVPLAGYTLKTRRAQAVAELLPTLSLDDPGRERVDELMRFYARTSPYGHLAITVGAALRSIVSSIVPAATALVAEGPAESGKTGSAMHALGAVLPAPYRCEADATFNETDTSAEAALSPIRDAPAVLDNFRIQEGNSTADAHKVVAKLDGMIIAAESGNEIRGRARRDSTKRRGNHVETLLLVNGEQLPPILVSTMRRIIHLPYVKGQDIDLDAMEQGESTYQPILTGIGHAIIHWTLAALANNRSELRSRIEQQENRYARHLLAHARSANIPGELYRSITANWARVLTGWWLAEQALGIVTVNEAGESVDGPLVSQWLPFVERHMTAQLRLVATGVPGTLGAEWYVDTILWLLGKKLAHALREDGQPMQYGDAPGSLDDWGYVQVGAEHDEWIAAPRTPCIGYVSANDGFFYLRSDLGRVMLQERAPKGVPGPWSKDQFTPHLLRIGLSKAHEDEHGKEHAARVIRVGSRTVRCAQIPLTVLAGDGEASSATQDDSRATSTPATAAASEPHLDGQATAPAGVRRLVI